MKICGPQPSVIQLFGATLILEECLRTSGNECNLLLHGSSGISKALAEETMP